MSSMQVLTLEDWDRIMFSVWRASGTAGSVVFFLIWVVMGKYTLLSLFLAVIMEAFEVAKQNRGAEEQVQVSRDTGVSSLGVILP
jgi:hypothetical protein